MAEVDESHFSLLSLEDELTCSICLSTFDCPVTIPCGHNFCQDCLLATWKESYSCPQCRTHFATKPELKKNTVLSTVVQTFNLRSTKSEASPAEEESKAKKEEVIRCDACMEAEASQTCLTCMASFCEEHLRPHRENPNFSLHQLSEPVGDLLERICTVHHKMMEFFCTQHGRPIYLNMGVFATGIRAASVSGFTFSEPQWAFPGQVRLPRPCSPDPGSQPKVGQKKKKEKQTKKAQSTGNDKARSMENLLSLEGKGEPAAEPETSDIPPNITSAEKRSELLKYGTVLTLDPKTAHKRITLSEGFTKASVSDEHTNYPDCPERFAVCSQVLTSKGFSRGRHYWEVRLSSSNFIGIGLAYNSIDRKGPTSRLGRNAQSWCVEWFNVKLSAWHNSSETVLVNPNPKRIGVLLDCEGGTATFYNVADRAYPFHSFVFPFAAAVYPAFWIFSSGSSISLCKLQA
ncbi:E3 ubiquitin/ISG15 ligase TRIM25-like [Micropterus dolomieu]|uniref:E3 ubiquitin/ISG15 ligase TRIM25-like n=1 Tax=Micropterus dolomieu TaxID=147949 RepID=UPI001E8DB083|nr:E3 ubiquitin/ISG15 ligase TRIM25-like [Micropterus dolomieu]